MSTGGMLGAAALRQQKLTGGSDDPGKAVTPDRARAVGCAINLVACNVRIWIR